MSLYPIVAITALIFATVFLVSVILYRERNMRNGYLQEIKRLKYIIANRENSILLLETQLLSRDFGIQARDATIKDIANIAIPHDCKDPIAYVNATIKAWTDRSKDNVPYAPIPDKTKKPT